MVVSQTVAYLRERLQVCSDIIDSLTKEQSDLEAAILRLDINDEQREQLGDNGKTGEEDAEVLMKDKDDEEYLPHIQDPNR